jgi:RecA-family ATPase
MAQRTGALLPQPLVSLTQSVRVDLSGDSPTERRLKVITAADLLTMMPDRPEWIAEPVVARSCISDLVAGPKVGKTTLVLALADAVSEGRLFLGKPTSRTRVLYLTEERGPTFRAALERVGIAGDDFRIVLRQAGAGMKWSEVMEDATAQALDMGAGLLVVDSLADWAALQGDSENSSGAVLEALRPIQAAAASGLAVILSRHDRKGPAAELGEAGRGSNATAGACDILMSLREGS